MTNLWSSNHPARFWLCQPDMPPDIWAAAIQMALPILGLAHQPEDVDHLLSLVLGEGQFGSNHWQLSQAKRWYYRLKPFIPRKLSRSVRRALNPSARIGFSLGWPVEDRYARFLWEVIRQLLLVTDQKSIRYVHFWPHGERFAFAVTHDVETSKGQSHIRAVADLEESFGFRSSFNFLPRCYTLDLDLLRELRERGFEIGIHGHKHDGKLFSSYTEFKRQANIINGYLKKYDAVGFRSPLMLRNPEWIQALELEYDLSFFDTDPFEPMPGGTMSLWPFTLGRFVELPYTLSQDSTLAFVLGETTPRFWFQKVNFIEKYQGMALINSHPDYLLEPAICKMYADFLHAMKNCEGYWHALPRDVAHWWRVRSNATIDLLPAGAILGEVQLTSNGVEVGCCGISQVKD